jgi:hypothetical protein
MINIVVRMDFVHAHVGKRAITTAATVLEMCTSTSVDL